MDFYSLIRYTGNAINYGCHVFNERMIQKNQGPCVVLIVGIALHVFRFRYPISYSLIGYSLGFFLGRQITDLGKQHKMFLLNKSTEQLRSIMSKTPKLRFYIFLISLSVCARAPSLSMTTALLSGLLTAAQPDMIQTSRESSQRSTYF